MKQTSIFRGLLVASLLAAPLLATAAHRSDDDASMHGDHDQHHRMNPVDRTQNYLDELQTKLHLKAEQQAAWKTYADSAIARASDRAKHMKEFRGRRGEHHADMHTAAWLEHMSKRMRKRADKLQQAAKDTGTFQQALSPEQQTIFDLYWKSQFGRGKWRHRR